jgi:Fe-S cluster assembly protein SufD
MNVMLVNPPIDESGLEAVATRLPGGAGILERRRKAYGQFARLGLPNRRVEDWKYTDLRALLGDVAPPVASPDPAALTRARTILERVSFPQARKLVLVDGAFAPELSDLSDEAGVRIRTLSGELVAGQPDVSARVFGGEPSEAVFAYNQAFVTDGVLIDVAAAVTCARPLHLIHVATVAAPAAIATRSLVTIGAEAGVSLIESFVGSDVAYQTYDVVSVELGDNARLEHVRLVESGAAAANICGANVRIGTSARYNLCALTTGGRLSRYQTQIICAGEGAEVRANGVNMLGGRQHGDTTVVMDHAVPNCVSREDFRAVLDGQAHSVFQGRIVVRPHAQKTDAKMMTRALLLSDEAEADNKPELEIFADDVTCGHGATTGALDESLLFYLRARGLDEKQAQALLIQAFVGEAIETITDEALRDAVVGATERWLAARI